MARPDNRKVTGDNGARDLTELGEDLGEDEVALLSAGSVNELRYRLLSPGPRRSNSADAELLLRTHHTTAPGALDTARLLLTDERWERLSRRLLQGLVATDLLTDDDLDALALELLDGERMAYQVDDLFSGGGIVVELPGPDGPDDEGGAEEDDVPDDGPEHGPLVALRRIPPPLRRWAAARAVGRALLTTSDLPALLDALPARDAAEAVRGMVDELDTLPPDEGDELLETALGWPARTVRSAALDRLIDRGDAERAARLAAADPDRSIRARAERRPDQQSLF
jgi:hypothetical protein